MKLTDSSIKAAKPKDKRYNLPDGKGLALWVQPDGQKCWRFRYYFNDKEKMLSLGFYPAVSLAAARTRKEKAQKLGISVSTLDKAVKAVKRYEIDDSGFHNVESWEHPVIPAELLNEISTTVHRFIVCNKETADAMALWVSMTWFMDVVQIAPLAVITAPEKRCGKTQLLTILGKLSYRPLSASSISSASLYRCIEALSPTLLLDETMHS